jgi:EAL domain-containing protein (putative c-di-GMP-specific phosphodiesterase class I)
MVYPDRFIPVAERTGQIQFIDRWVIENALSAMEAQDELRLSINLSATAMDDPLLLSDLARLLRQHRIEPNRLSFEVTETAAINSLVNAKRLMRGMQELGCRFALDDFGSGYASYAYLRKLPVDEVKIDGAFIRELARESGRSDLRQGDYRHGPRYEQARDRGVRRECRDPGDSSRSGGRRCPGLLFQQTGKPIKL